MANGAIPGGSLYDRSGTITSGGTAQQLAAANGGRQYLLIQNNSSADLWVNFGTTAVVGQPSIKIASGGAIEYSAHGTGVVPTALVSIIGGTTSQAFTAKEL